METPRTELYHLLGDRRLISDKQAIGLAFSTMHFNGRLETISTERRDFQDEGKPEGLLHLFIFVPPPPCFNPTVSALMVFITGSAVCRKGERGLL